MDDNAVNSLKMNKEITLEKRAKVAEIILQARIQKGLTQTELADRIGFARNTIVRIENCRFSPNSDQLYALCAELDIKLELDSNVI